MKVRIQEMEEVKKFDNKCIETTTIACMKYLNKSFSAKQSR